MARKASKPAPVNRPSVNPTTLQPYEDDKPQPLPKQPPQPTPPPIKPGKVTRPKQ